MSNNRNAVSQRFSLPQEFFTVATFGTASGCALVTWIVSGVLSGLFRIDPGFTGLIVAMVVAYVGLFLSKARQKEQYVITFFNGFLIYAMVVGGTSFSPYINRQTAKVVQEKRPSIKATLARPWIPDRNLLLATENLLEIREKQTASLDELDKTIATVKDSLAREVNLPAASKADLLERLSLGKTNIQSTRKRLESNITSLERVGVIRRLTQPRRPTPN